MEYLVATKKHYHEIIKMKNRVKERVAHEGLSIWRNGYPCDAFIQDDIERKEARIAVLDGKIVGYACFHQAKTEYPSQTFKKDELYSFGRLMVEEGYTGIGIGHFLVRHLIEEARSVNALGVGILVDACNYKALRLYKKNGFQREGSKDFDYGFFDIYGLYF